MGSSPRSAVPELAADDAGTDGGLAPTAGSRDAGGLPPPAVHTGHMNFPGTAEVQFVHDGLNSGHRPFVYEIWHRPGIGGKNRIRCWGYCVTGPPQIDVPYNFCAWFCILGPSVVCMCLPYLWHISVALPLTILFLLCTTVVSLLLTQCSDPGIIPRKDLQQLVHGLDGQVAVATGMREAGSSSPQLPSPAVSNTYVPDPHEEDPESQLTEEQEARGYRWCRTCKVVRPARASHCRDCDNCVLTFDHHCPFVNNCVGQRNYRFFSALLVSVTCLGASVILGFILWLTHKAGQDVNRRRSGGGASTSASTRSGG